MYKKAKASFWTAEEMDLPKDVHDWNNHLNDNERHFISPFSPSSQRPTASSTRTSMSVSLMEFKSAEARCFYGFQIMMENIHSETYSLLIDTYSLKLTLSSSILTDSTQHDYLFNAIGLGHLYLP
jgi:ribonucleoside-diphosphate reductase subunit M2